MRHIICSDYFECDKELLCYRCLTGSKIRWVFVEDGNTDDEQYLCTRCAEAVAEAEALGRLRISKGGRVG